MRTWMRAGCSLVVMLLITESGLTQADSYSAIHIADTGPYQVWQGVDSEDQNYTVVAVIGASKSIRLRVPIGAPIPQVSIGAGYVDITLPVTTYGLDPIQPPIPENIVYCSNRGYPEGIYCICKWKENSVCNMIGVVNGTPTLGVLLI